MIDDPVVLQRLVTEVVTQNVQDAHDTLKDTMENGYLFWTVKPPAVRYQEYWNRTLKNDFYLIMTDDYLERRKAGTLPELQCVQEWNALAQAQTPPPNGDLKPYFWALMLLSIFPDFVFRYYQRDFIQLEQAQLKKDAVGVS